MKYVKRFLRSAKQAGVAFMDDKCLKLSAALSYYTIFSIGPMLIIVISLSGLFYGRDAVQGKLYGQIRGLIGSDAALQVQDIIKNIHKTADSTIGAIVGAVILVLGATGIFTEIQDSINYIWSLRAKPKRGFVKLLINRLLSFSLIISLGFLLLVSLLANALMDLLSTQLTKFVANNSTVFILYVMNVVIILGVISLLFAVIFKVLPDGKIRWKDAFRGALFTAVLFMLGKIGIGYYLGNANLGVTYGTAASIIIILTWVYYTSIILYYGAEFTKIYALEYGGGIIPDKTAVFIIKSEAKEIDIYTKDPNQKASEKGLSAPK